MKSLVLVLAPGFALALGLAVVLGVALHASPARAGGDSSGQLATEVASAFGLYNRYSATQLPTLTSEQFKDLLKGKVVKIRRGHTTPPPGLPAGERAERVYGMMIFEQPRANVWIAAMDPHYVTLSILKELRLASDSDGGCVWYQHLKLPWPISDRHWTIALGRTPALTDSTGGVVWEQRWRLADNGLQLGLEAVTAGRVPGLTLEVAQKSVYTPVNEGSWTAFTLSEDRTLLVYYVSSSVGGSISDDIVADFATATLDKLFKVLTERGATIASHYIEGHEPLFGGDGKPIPPSAVR
jgi:hypothetical protein